MSGFSEFCFFEHFFLFKRKNIMKSTYQHIFSPLTVKKNDYQKPYCYDAYGHKGSSMEYLQ